MLYMYRYMCVGCLVERDQRSEDERRGCCGCPNSCCERRGGFRVCRVVVFNDLGRLFGFGSINVLYFFFSKIVPFGFHVCALWRALASQPIAKQCRRRFFDRTCARNRLSTRVTAARARNEIRAQSHSAPAHSRLNPSGSVCVPHSLSVAVPPNTCCLPQR